MPDPFNSAELALGYRAVDDSPENIEFSVTLASGEVKTLSLSGLMTCMHLEGILRSDDSLTKEDKRLIVEHPAVLALITTGEDLAALIADLPKELAAELLVKIDDEGNPFYKKITDAATLKAILASVSAEIAEFLYANLNGFKDIITCGFEVMRIVHAAPALEGRLLASASSGGFAELVDSSRRGGGLWNSDSTACGEPEGSEVTTHAP